MNHPEHWTTAELQELGGWKTGSTPRRSNEDYWGGDIQWVSPKDMKTDRIVDTEDHMTEKALEETNSEIIPPGSLIMVTRSGILEHSFPVAINENPVTINQDLKAFIPSNRVNEEYVYYYLESREIDILKNCSKDGTTVASINSDSLYAYEIPIISKKEQEQLVERIEELLSKLDSGVLELDKSKQQLDQYRQSVLKKAVNGGLTRDWRSARNQKGINNKEEVQFIDGEHQVEGDLANLPEGWGWAKLGDITENFDNKREPISKSERAEMQGEYPYYGASGIIDHLNDYILDGRYLLISEDGANLENRTKPIAFTVDGKFWPNNHAHVVQTKFGIPLDYLELYLESRSVLRYLTGTAQPKLTQTNLNKIPVPIGPQDELKKIVESVQRKLSVIESTTNEIDNNLTRAEGLRQSILTKAFEGNSSSHNLSTNPTNEGLESGDEKPEPAEQKTLSEVTSDGE